MVVVRLCALPDDVLVIIAQIVAFRDRESLKCTRDGLSLLATCHSLRDVLAPATPCWLGEHGLRRQAQALCVKNRRVREYLNWSGSLTSAASTNQVFFEAACDVWLADDVYDYDATCRRLRLQQPTLDDFRRERHKVLSILARHRSGFSAHDTTDVSEALARIWARIERARGNCRARRKGLKQPRITAWLVPRARVNRLDGVPS